jgi:uncharacterized protein YndB with AHSA1/START domain
MTRISGEILIDAPVERVFDAVADQRNEPTYNPRMIHVDMLTPDPIGVGTRWHGSFWAGRRRTGMTTVVTEFDRPHRIASTTTLPSARIRGAVAFAEQPDGTRMCWSWDVRPTGVMRLLGPVVGLIGRRQERSIWTGLKRLLERAEVPR